ncbi:hypothetical protein JHK85_008506 [Glycine max]|nr:hypothetical protein JHK85_008506 [Glycine max]
MKIATYALNSRLGCLNIEETQGLEAVTNEMVRLIETATVPVLAVDVNGMVNGWNTKIAELTGLPSDEAMGKHFLTLVEDFSVDRVKKMLHMALQGEEEEERNVQFEINTYDFKIDSGPVSLVVNACASRDLQDNIVGVCFVAQGITAQKTMMEKFPRIEGDYKAIVQNPNPLIPPLFNTDEFGWCCEWNSAMAKLTGWKREEVMDKMLLGEIFGTQIAGCRLRNHEAVVNFSIVLNTAMAGLETEKVPIGFFTRDGKHVECLLSVTKKLDAEGAVTGVFCFLQLASPELQQALHIQLLSEQTALKRLKDLNYLKRQIRNPLYGIMFSRKLLEGTELGAEQKQFLQTSTQCQRQLSKILDNSDLDSIIDGYDICECVASKTLLNQMFGRDGHESEEGISMLISRKLLKLMKGDVRYIREAGKSSFILSVELAAAHKSNT